MAFNVGDTVEWKSQSGGYSKIKRGEVVLVLSPGEPLKTEKLNRAGLRTNSSCGYGLPRYHESYVVRIGNQAYWPRVKNLHRPSLTPDKQ